jgi:hypothetical protein
LSSAATTSKLGSDTIYDILVGLSLNRESANRVGHHNLKPHQHPPPKSHPNLQRQRSPHRKDRHPGRHLPRRFTSRQTKSALHLQRSTTAWPTPAGSERSRSAAWPREASAVRVIVADPLNS